MAIPNHRAVVILAALVTLLAGPAAAQTPEQKAHARTVLTEEFAKYPRPHSAATTGKILNDAALRAPGWVLLGKKGGNRCPLPDGRDISCDFLVWRATVRGWDVIGSVGATNSNVSGPSSGDGEDMTAMLARGSRTLENPVGAVTPPVTPPPSPPLDLAKLQATVDALNQALARFIASTHERFDALELQVIPTLTGIGQQLQEHAEGAPPPALPVVIPCLRGTVLRQSVTLCPVAP